MPALPKAAALHKAVASLDLDQMPTPLAQRSQYTGWEAEEDSGQSGGSDYEDGLSPDEKEAQRQALAYYAKQKADADASKALQQPQDADFVDVAQLAADQQACEAEEAMLAAFKAQHDAAAAAERLSAQPAHVQQAGVPDQAMQQHHQQQQQRQQQQMQQPSGQQRQQPTVQQRRQADEDGNEEAVQDAEAAKQAQQARKDHEHQLMSLQQRQQAYAEKRLAARKELRQKEGVQAERNISRYVAENSRYVLLRVLCKGFTLPANCL